MNERLAKVLDYEQRLLRDRQELQNLIAESDQQDSQLILDKLDYFAVELTHMQRQIQLLKGDVAQKAPITAQPVATVRDNVPHTHPTMAASKSNALQAPPAVTALQTKAPQTKPAVAKDLEKTIGKSLMGIFASVLIFISLILFATLILPYFNDTAKMVTTYVVSFAFIFLGLFKLKKDKENKFYIALTGCGVGALYISLLLSNIYFKVIGDITLYVLIALWGAGICYLSKLQNRLFEIIGHLGILISIMFGCILCTLNSDATKFTVLLLFYLVSSVAFYVVHCKRALRENIIFHCFNLVNCFLLSTFSLFTLTPGFSFSYIIMPVILAFYIGILFWNHTEGSWGAFGVFMSIYIYTLYCSLTIFPTGSDTITSTVYFIIAALLILALERKSPENRWGQYIPQIVLIWTSVASIEYIPIPDFYGMIFLVMLPLLALGFLRKNAICKYSVLICLFPVCFQCTAKVSYFLCGIVAIVAIFFCIYKCREQYSMVYKYCTHGLTLLFMLCTLSDMLHDLAQFLYLEDIRFSMVPAITYTLFAVYNICMLKSCFGKNLKTGIEERHSPYYIINVGLMLYGLSLIGEKGDGFWHLLAIFTTLAVFMLNAKNLLDKRDNMLCGIYVGLKFAILIYVILGSFDAVNYVVSIVFFIFAIACIMLGFQFQYKALRIFGLVLSMVSTFKLIMVDITYDNTLGHALSFFISGILCFAISLIYNFIDKKMNREDETNRSATE